MNFKEANVQLLTDDDCKDGILSRETILRELERLFENARQGDTLVLFSKVTHIRSYS